MSALLSAHAALAWALILMSLSAPVPAAEPALSLDEAVRLALERQPVLNAQAARLQAARERAGAASALPDPQFTLGFDNVAVDAPNPWAADADGMTMTSVGLMQEFPNRQKRVQRQRRAQALAASADAGLALLRLAVARDAALAWLDLWQPLRALELVDALVAETAQQHDVARIAYRSGSGGQAGVHAAALALGLLEDRRRAQLQAAGAARAGLARWIGEAALRDPGGVPAQVPPLPLLADALARVDAHPQLQLGARAADAAQAEVALAQADYRPDWRLQAMYGYRRPFDDMVSLQLGIDLPVFTGRRQDRGLAAAHADHLAAQADVDGLRRELRAAVEVRLREWGDLGERLTAYDAHPLPAATAGAAAALAEYRSGKGSLAALLAARSAVLDTRLQRLELQAGQLRSRIELAYLLAETDASIVDAGAFNGSVP